ncbi:hypothetical protein [Schwartzia sp. (in: firmicutes)]
MTNVLSRESPAGARRYGYVEFSSVSPADEIISQPRVAYVTG